MNVVLDAFYSLGRDLNKMKGSRSVDTQQGIVSEKMPELALDMSDEEIVRLTKKWEDLWLQSEVKADMDKKGTENENYWKGYHYQRPEVDKTRAMIDNVIFEALETYLPQITRQDPEAMVELAGKPDQTTPQMEQFVGVVKDKLAEIADEIRLRIKLKKTGRHWALYLVGVLKAGWDMNRDIPTVKVIRPQKIILDPNATIDEDGYTGEYIGEYRKLPANILLEVIGEGEGTTDARQAVNDLVKDDLGTELQFIEWWTDRYTVWTMNKKVLLKKKNPYWNYDQENEPQAKDENAAEGAEEAMEEEHQPADMQEGEPAPVQHGVNHLPVPKKPYFLLSVFNLGKRPIDDTSLIGQNLSNQDTINKRKKQIDKNADSANNGIVVSLEKSGLTTQQAKGVTEALRKGGTVAVPSGSAQEAVYRPQLPELPGFVIQDMNDTRQRVKDIFGTSALVPNVAEKTETYRGAILAKTLDTDRIGGGIAEYIEQIADDVFNYLVQLLFVLDEKFLELISTGQAPKIKVSVKEGSLLPKDSVSIANQSIALANQGKMALIDLYKKLDYPNPEELAANVWLEANAPELLFANNPLVQKAIQMKQEQAQQAAAASAAAEQAKSKNKVAESINFKDLPPEGQAQLARQAGIELHAEGIAAHDQHKEARETAHAIAIKTSGAPVTPQLPGETSPLQ